MSAIPSPPVDGDELALGSEHVRYEKRDAIGFITLNRPGVGNAISDAMHKDLARIWGDVRDDPSVRVAIVTGTGDRHFCTGADMGAVADEGTMVQGEGPMSQEVRISPRQNQVWKPVICAVNGVASGAGLHLVVDADLIVASSNAQFMDTHVNVGQVGGIENVGLAKRLPLGSALRITLIGKAYRMSAERAYALGLADELVDPSDLMPTCLTLAEQIKQNSPQAVSFSQQAIWGSLEVGYTAAMEYGWSLVRLHRHHPDSREGPSAFAERRSPTWVD